MKVLITGGAGFIGSNVTIALLEKGYEIIIIDDLSSGFVSNIPNDSKVIFVEGSVTNDSILKKGFSYKPDYILHFAAQFANQNSVDHPISDLETNGLGTLKLLEMARKHTVKKVLYSSSSCVYANSDKPLGEDNAIHLETPYAVTKLLGEHYMLYYHRMFNLPVVILRYFNTYGPGEYPGKYRNVIPNFIQMALDRKPLTITGSGNETRAFTYVDDIVTGTIAALLNEGTNGCIFNMGSDVETQIIDLAHIINRQTSNNAGIVYIKQRNWDKITRRAADISRARDLFAYTPTTPLINGIKTTIDWIAKISTHDYTK